MNHAKISAHITEKAIEAGKNKKLRKIIAKIDSACGAGKYLWFASARTLKELQNMGYTITGGKFRYKISWEKVDA